MKSGFSRIPRPTGSVDMCRARHRVEGLSLRWRSTLRWRRRARRQTCLDVAQTLAPCQLRAGHRTELLGARQCAYTRIAPIALHDAREARPRHELHNVREERLANIRGYVGIPREGQPGEGIRFSEIEVQVGTKQNQPTTLANARFPVRDRSFNRTAGRAPL